MEDFKALTPNHILQLKAKLDLPSGLFKKEDLFIQRCWRQVQYLTALFWKRWVKEYLPLMQQQQKWNKPCRNFSIRDLVVYEAAPTNSWPLGCITQTLVDSKGFGHTVRLETQTSKLERLCLLMEAVC